MTNSLKTLAAGKTAAQIAEMIEELQNARIIAVRDEYVALMKRIIQQYEEGAITVKEMANALIAKTSYVIDQLPGDPEMPVPDWLIEPAPAPTPMSVEALADFVMTVTDHPVVTPSNETVDDDIPF